MGLGKILGGIACGIGAVALAPVLLPAAAVAAAAAGTAAAGAAAAGAAAAAGTAAAGLAAGTVGAAAAAGTAAAGLAAGAAGAAAAGVAGAAVAGVATAAGTVGAAAAIVEAGTVIAGVATVGAAGVAIGSSGKKEAVYEAKKTGIKEGATAQRGKDKKKLEDQKKEYEERLIKVQKEYGSELFNANLYAMCALGYSIAWADGKVTKEEIDAITFTIEGFSAETIPVFVKNQLKKIKENASSSSFSFNDAMKYLDDLFNQDFQSQEQKVKIWEDLEEFLITIMKSDGIFSQNEKAFIEAFRSLKNRYL